MKELSIIQELKLQYANLVYESGSLFNGDDLVELDGDSLIEDHYENMPVTKAHPSGNPELEYFDTASGREFIELEYNNDYEEAFNQI